MAFIGWRWDILKFWAGFAVVGFLAYVAYSLMSSHQYVQEAKQEIGGVGDFVNQISQCCVERRATTSVKVHVSGTLDRVISGKVELWLNHPAASARMGPVRTPVMAPVLASSESGSTKF